MDKVYKYIIQKTVTDKIDKKDAVQLLELLKQEKDKNRQIDIAVIGVAVKTSRANNVREFWDNLKTGLDCIRSIPTSRQNDLDEYLRFKGVAEDEMKYRELAYFDEIDKFDYEYFNLSPREAELMDPNQRMFLETAYSAIEDAGISKNKIKGTKTGLYLGFITANYSYQNLLYEVDAAVGASTILANLAALIPSRVSYNLDLRGPSMLVDTTCSSSLVAVHLACQALRSRECNQAIVGGIKINLLPLSNSPKIGIESSSNRTLAFDEKSDGTGQGEGVGVIVLKPLKDALRDGDNIQAIIKGSAINQDGRSIGITAPNSEAQTEVISSAWESAQIDPSTISFIEAHGTGTKLGDPIEIEGINKAFKQFTDKKQFCAVASVKSNLGHLDEAAGIFGLIKTVLSLKNKRIPASLNFHEPNHKINWEESPVYVNDRFSDWENSGKTPRRAGVSSYGLSGTNCHVVLEEAKTDKLRETLKKQDKIKIFTITAKNKTSLDDLVCSYLKYFYENEKINLDDACFTANTGRNHYNYRLIIIFKNYKDLVEKLEKLSKVDYLKNKISEVYYNNFLIINKKKQGDYEFFKSKIQENSEAINKIIENSKNKNILDNFFYEKICLAYIEGANIDWDKLYENESCKKISLPTYSFQKKRCWFNIPKGKQKDIHYELAWRTEKLKIEPIINSEVLIFKGKSRKSINIYKALLKELGQENIIEVELGEKFKIINQNKYVVSSSLKDFEKLFLKLKERNFYQIIHLFSLEDNNREIKDLAKLNESQEKGVFTLFYTAKALRKYASDKFFNIVLVSDFVNQITGKEKILKPENASLFGLSKGLFIELPGWQFRTIDIDEKINLNDLIKEIRNEYSNHKVAYRDGQRYVEEFRKIELNSNKNLKIRPEGVYLFTGGTGGVVLELLKYLSRIENIKIVLLSRSKFPAKNLWKNILDSEGSDKIIKNKIETFLEIEKRGSKIFFYSADVSNEKQIRETLTKIKKEIGEINGVVHAAGVAHEKEFDLKNEIEFREILQAKVQGTFLLDSIIEKENLDFFSLFSSAITCFGGAHNGDYIAANSYLDSYAFLGRKKGVNFTAVNWPFWEQVGMHIRQVINQDKVPLKNIPSQLAAEEWYKSLSNKKPGFVIIGELNHDSKSAYLIKHSPFTFSNEIISEIEKNIDSFSRWEKNDQVELRGSEENNYSEVEKNIAQILYDVLGYKEIDISDNFFDLGSDSLFLAEIFSRLEKKYPNRLNITHLFTYPTVAKLSQFISQGHENNSLKQLESRKTESRDIAIIGLAAKTSLADNYQELWENLLIGRECIREIPKQRKGDIDNYLRMIGAEEKYLAYSPLAYLTNIDHFDYEYFKFSPREAKLMDPTQRLFLETVITAMEEAGYGGEKLKGSNTGLYLGYGQSDFEYKSFINNSKTSNSTALFTGNLNALIPSRLSYLLDLRGPSMVVDTACSSSLVAVHLACQSLLSGDCDLAVAGGVRLNLVPILNRFKVGIESSDWLTRTFDNASDGTGMGEGVAAIILKPLEKAIADGDNVFAVIKGSAVNQDGQSVGITAPNTRAQSEVISSAWINSQINPTDISYIEAHGTGTSLGDPIEIEGITNAFRHYTDKKQFCAIGAIKPNLGHSLEAAGIFSLIKAVLSLKNKKLLPSINFHEPNQQVDWENSAVYVNDKLKNWNIPKTAKRLCGVSSFGLSGTNCHIVLGEVESLNSEDIKENDLNVFTISAKNRSSFLTLIDNYYNFFNKNLDLNWSSVCYTANTGRGHYEERLAIVADSLDCLIEKLNIFKNSLKTDISLGIYFNTHSIVSTPSVKTEGIKINEQKINELSKEAKPYVNKLSQTEKINENFAKKICQFYIKGAKIDWEKIYANRKNIKLSLPTYPFLKNRCWADTSDQTQMEGQTASLHYLHPLVEKCLVKSSEQDIYSTIFSSEKHFVLGDHIINGSHVLPGTVYVEIAKQIGRLYYGEIPLEIKNLSFITPVISDRGEKIEVQIVVRNENGFKRFYAVSKVKSLEGVNQERWLRHAEGEIHPRSKLIIKTVRLDEIKKRCAKKKIDVDINKNAAGFIDFGLRWQNFHLISFGEKEALAELELPKECLHDLESYYTHPSMLDMAVAAVSMVTGFKALPFSYDSFKIFAPMPRKFYSYFKRIGDYNEVEETVGFDIELLDQHGKVFAEIENFKLKRTRDFTRVIQKNKGKQKTIFYKVDWRAQALTTQVKEETQENILVFGTKSKRAEDIVTALLNNGNKIISVNFGSNYEKIDEENYIIKNCQEDFIELFKNLDFNKIKKIINLFPFELKTPVSSLGQLKKSQDHGPIALFYFVKALAKNLVKQKLDIILISEYVDRVTGTEEIIKPENSLLFGFAKVIAMEDSNWRCRAIDIDKKTETKIILKEIYASYSVYKVAYRKNLRYTENLEKYDIMKAEENSFKIRTGGNYLITGGTGGVGLAVAERLAKNNRVNIVLLNRSDFPKRSNWNDILENKKPGNERYKKVIEQIIRIENNKSRVLIVSADITNINDTKKVFLELRKEIGDLNGIIHAAGVPGDGFIFNKDEATIRSVLAPKVQGTWVLDELTKNYNLDFFVLFSSTTSLHGAAGQSDYTAANSYLDSFVHYRNLQGRKTLVVNWSGWKEVGMLSESHSFSNHGMLSNEEALVSLFAVLKREISNVVIGSLAYMGNLAFDVHHLAIELSAELKTEIFQNSLLRAEIQAGNKQELKIKVSDNDNYNEMEKEIATIWSEVLGINEIDVNDHFFDLGGDSLRIAETHSMLEKKYPGKFSVAELFAYPTIAKLVQHVGVQDSDQKIFSDERNHNQNQDIAIIGMSARTSNSENLEEYWENLIQGRDCIREIPETRKKDVDDYLRFKGVDEKYRKCHVAAYLEDIDKFDNEFFKISPREAELMDPNQRALLETVYHTIENAGYNGRRLNNSKTGLYVGLFPLGSKYYDLIAELEPSALSEAMVNNMEPTIASRISYYLNLTGPSMLVNTACSSSLVAVHLACQAIRSGDCSQAIVGSVKISLLTLANNPQVGIESKDGHTRTFDNDSDGTGLGEGVAAVMLKPLAQAIIDGDNILSIIKGSAINQDGQSVGITAPNVISQTEVILSAWQAAKINPETISYIEAHGTGTNLGDPIEIEALSSAFKKYTNKKQFCAVASVKSNLGHLLEAAGIFGLIKSVLILNHKKIPPSINLHEPNQKVNWEDSPVFINNRAVDWQTNENFPRRIGISSFGLSGTNCHVVLEEAPIKNKKSKDDELSRSQIFILSARNRDGLLGLVKKYIELLEKNNLISLEDICYTLSTGRDHHNHRLALVGDDILDLKGKLQEFMLSNFESSKSNNFEYGEFKIVPFGQKIKSQGELTEKEALSQAKEIEVLAQEIIYGENQNKEILKKICQLYVSGANFDWQKLYKENKCQKISLPLYPFARQRAWLNIPGVNKYPDYFHGIKWRQKNNEGQKKTINGPILVFTNKQVKAKKIVQELSKTGREIIKVQIGEECKKINKNNFTIRDHKDDYRFLMTELVKRDFSQIVHLLTLDTRVKIEDIDILNESQRRGIFSLLFLTQALQENYSLRNFELFLVSENVDSVTNEDKIIKPENATYFGFGKAVSLENPNILCRSIDIDDASQSSVILNEINFSAPEFKTAYRNGNRYIEELVKLDLSSLEDNDESIKIKSNGAYLITGGTGGIGLEIARQMAKTKNIKLALLNRNEIPSRTEWEGIINSEGPKDKSLINKIKSLQEIENFGAEIIFLKADISNPEQVKEALAMVRKEFGKLDGIIHAAGSADEGFVVNKGEVALRNVLAPKIQGTWLLDNLTRDEDLDFFILFSSAITLVSGISVGDYTAANSYLDSYSYYASLNNRRITTINWATWENIGLSANEEVNEKKQLLKILPINDAVSLLFEIIKKKISRIVVGKLNYDSDLLFLGDYLPLNFSDEIKNKTVKEVEIVEKQIREVKLKGGINNEYTETEKELASIWCEVLGYKEIDIRDNFFELGGDSLAGIRLIARVNKQINRNLSFREILQNPTLKDLAKYVSQSDEVKYNPVIKKVKPKQYKIN